ncbi:hypothetical protein [Faecalicoccus pleomorphus]|nr:hypothetical protein [Faecalicoccus pleomorphus]
MRDGLQQRRYPIHHERWDGNRCSEITSKPVTIPTLKNLLYLHIV